MYIVHTVALFVVHVLPNAMGATVPLINTDLLCAATASEVVATTPVSAHLFPLALVAVIDAHEHLGNVQRHLGIGGVKKHFGKQHVELLVEIRTVTLTAWPSSFCEEGESVR